MEWDNWIYASGKTTMVWDLRTLRLTGEGKLRKKHSWMQGGSRLHVVVLLLFLMWLGVFRGPVPWYLSFIVLCWVYANICLVCIITHCFICLFLSKHEFYRVVIDHILMNSLSELTGKTWWPRKSSQYSARPRNKHTSLKSEKQKGITMTKKDMTSCTGETQRT